jgi:hypothetical protein
MAISLIKMVNTLSFNRRCSCQKASQISDNKLYRFLNPPDAPPPRSKYDDMKVAARVRENIKHSFEFFPGPGGVMHANKITHSKYIYKIPAVETLQKPLKSGIAKLARYAIGNGNTTLQFVIYNT